MHVHVRAPKIPVLIQYAGTCRLPAPNEEDPGELIDNKCDVHFSKRDADHP